MTRWFEKNGPKGDVVVASRVRLARNRWDYAFSLKLNEADAKKMIADTLARIKKVDEFADYDCYDFDELNEFQKMAMKERHVISKFLTEQGQAAGLVSPDEEVSIMINEEDHIRIQAYAAGMDMNRAYERASHIDDVLGKVIEYAYHQQYGYLTTCPTNAGTGMRASYLLHLPALSGMGQVSSIIREVGRFGLSMKGAYGEGNACPGDIYTISNQITLGLSEKEIIDNLDNIVEQIIDQERTARQKYVSYKRISAQDTAYRSYGVLRFARKMSLKDAMVLLSEFRMGLFLDLLKSDEAKDFSVYQMMIGILPNNLQLMQGKELEGEDIEVERARFIRDNLPLIQ